MSKERAVAAEIPGVLVRAVDRETPEVRERADSREVPGPRERAVLPATPISTERAVTREVPEGVERAVTLEPSESGERAVTRETPGGVERAATSEVPADDERHEPRGLFGRNGHCAKKALLLRVNPCAAHLSAQQQGDGEAHRDADDVADQELLHSTPRYRETPPCGGRPRCAILRTAWSTTWDSSGSRGGTPPSGHRPGRSHGGQRGIVLRLARLNRPGALRNPARIISPKSIPRGVAELRPQEKQ